MPGYRDSTGAIVHVDPADVATAESAGWTPVEVEPEAAPVLGELRETEEERSARAIEIYREEQFGGVGGQVLAGIEGGLDVATGGLSSVLAERFATEAGAGEQFREERRIAREVNQAGRVVGQVAGAVLPQGLAARVGARVAAGARAAGASRGGVAVTAGAFEGAMQGAGVALAEQALTDRPYSAEAIASGAIGGALVGGAFAGGMTALGAGLSRGGRALAGEGDEIALAARAADDLTGAGSRNPIPWRKLYTEADVRPAAVTTPARKLVREVSVAPARADEVATELAELASPMRLAAIDDAAGRQLVGEADTALRAYREAAAEAREWARPLGLEATKATGKRSLPRLLTENPDEAIGVLGRFDEASIRLERAMGNLRAATAPEIAGSAAPAARSGLGALVARTKDRVAGSRAAGVAVDVAAGAELLGEVTGVQPSRLLRGVPVIGEATSLYLQYRALRNAFASRGAIASSPAARAASQAASVGDRIRAAVSRAASRGGAAVSRQSTALARAAVAAAPAVIDKLAKGEPAIDMAAVDAATAGLPEDVAVQARTAADRAAGYLAKRAPRNVLGDLLGQSRRPVPASEVRRFGFEVEAVREPAAAVAAVLSGAHPQPSTAVAAVREVYPQLYEFTRAELAEQARALTKRLTAGARAHLGALWAVPLSVELLPGAGRMADAPPPEPQPPVSRGTPPPAGSSATVDVFATPEAKRKTS